MAQREAQIELAVTAIRTGEPNAHKTSPNSRPARVSMEQQIDVPHTNTARGSLFDKRSFSSSR
ncbi:hypothetical protein D6C87_10694, partial [Aureobasidium pullulans]